MTCKNCGELIMKDKERKYFPFGWVHCTDDYKIKHWHCDKEAYAEPNYLEQYLKELTR